MVEDVENIILNRDDEVNALSQKLKILYYNNTHFHHGVLIEAFNQLRSLLVSRTIAQRQSSFAATESYENFANWKIDKKNRRKYTEVFAWRYDDSKSSNYVQKQIETSNYTASTEHLKRPRSTEIFVRNPAIWKM